MSDNERVIKSYVWHGDTCFFVSTIERDSSAAADPSRYNETIVWKFDWEKNTRGEMIWQDEDLRGSVSVHLEICEQLHTAGEIPKGE